MKGLTLAVIAMAAASASARIVLLEAEAAFHTDEWCADHHLGEGPSSCIAHDGCCYDGRIGICHSCDAHTDEWCEENGEEGGNDTKANVKLCVGFSGCTFEYNDDNVTGQCISTKDPQDFIEDVATCEEKLAEAVEAADAEYVPSCTSEGEWSSEQTRIEENGAEKIYCADVEGHEIPDTIMTAKAFEAAMINCSKERKKHAGQQCPNSVTLSTGNGEVMINDHEDVGNCDITCNTDRDCDGEEWCCYNGCGYSCQVPITPKADCETLVLVDGLAASDFESTACSGNGDSVNEASRSVKGANAEIKAAEHTLAQVEKDYDAEKYNTEAKKYCPTRKDEKGCVDKDSTTACGELAKDGACCEWDAINTKCTMSIAQSKKNVIRAAQERKADEQSSNAAIVQAKSKVAKAQKKLAELESFYDDNCTVPGKDHGTSVTISCAEGWFGDDPVTIECKHGSWDEYTMDCKKDYAAEYNVLYGRNRDYEIKGRGVHHGDSRKVMCAKGYGAVAGCPDATRFYKEVMECVNGAWTAPNCVMPDGSRNTGEQSLECSACFDAPNLGPHGWWTGKEEGRKAAESFDCKYFASRPLQCSEPGNEGALENCRISCRTCDTMLLKYKVKNVRDNIDGVKHKDKWLLKRIKLTKTFQQDVTETRRTKVAARVKKSEMAARLAMNALKKEEFLAKSGGSSSFGGDAFAADAFDH